MNNSRDFLIVTNNPLVQVNMEEYFQLQYFPDMSYREILVWTRDKIYQGHTLYTHPLSGSVKPNETPYKSLVISVKPHGMEDTQAALISDAIVTFDKFRPRGRELSAKVLSDFQLVDFTLVASAVDFDAARFKPVVPASH